MPHEGSLSISTKIFDRIYNLLLCSWEETEKHKTTISPTRSLLFFLQTCVQKYTRIRSCYYNLEYTTLQLVF